MAVFEYKALADTGRSVKGIIDADSPVAARRKLREQNLYPTKLKESFGEKASKKEESGFQLTGVSTRDLVLMTRQLAVLLKAGMPLVESLTTLVDQTPNAKLRKAVFDIKDRVSEGKALADGLSNHPKIFSSLYINMIRAGEASGTLEKVLFRLVDILDHQAKLKAKITSTLAYPIFMMLFALSLISFLTLVVVPKITELFEKRDIELPQLTKILIGTTEFIQDYWYALIIGVLVFFALWRLWISTKRGRRQWDFMRLKFPLLGPLHLKLVCGRFSRILGTMLESGLTMMKALEVVTTVLQNTHMEDKMEDVKAGVRRGRGLAVPLKEMGFMPPMLINMIDLGQRSGELDDMLKQVADTYDNDVEVTIDALVSLLEPVIIIFMGLFVGILVMSILLPILEMSSGIN
jgi:general secretion pathway protein F